MSAILEARALGRRAGDDGPWLLDDIHLTLAAGERVALVGPSGSGKSLLLRSLGLLDPIDTGAVLWGGREILDEEVPAYRSRAIYLHQTPHLLNGTVRRNLERVFELRQHRDRTFDPKWTEDRLRRLGRDPSFLDKSIRVLSGGEAQIVALLRALQIEPQALLLDEPTAALDATGVEALERLVADWHSAAPDRRAYIWVGHDPRQAERVALRVLRIEAGRLVEGAA